MPKQKQPQDDPEQSKRFIETARQHQADETAEGARRAFKRATERRPMKSAKPATKPPAT